LDPRRSAGPCRCQAAGAGGRPDRRLRPHAVCTAGRSPLPGHRQWQLHLRDRAHLLVRCRPHTARGRRRVCAATAMERRRRRHDLDADPCLRRRLPRGAARPVRQPDDVLDAYRRRRQRLQPDRPPIRHASDPDPHRCAVPARGRRRPDRRQRHLHGHRQPGPQQARSRPSRARWRCR
jgi:hypothetical protein